MYALYLHSIPFEYWKYFTNIHVKSIRNDFYLNEYVVEVPIVN